MKQAIILYQMKRRNKYKFYQTFFSIRSGILCKRFFLGKELLSTLLSSLILILFYQKGADIFDLSQTLQTLVVAVIGFLQFIGGSASTNSHISSNLELYRLVSDSFWDFFRKTILSHFCADLLFKLSTLLPMLLITTLLAPCGLPLLLGGMVFGTLFGVNLTLHDLTKTYKTRLHSLLALLKTCTFISLGYLLCTIGMRLLKTVFALIKVALLAETYDDNALSEELLLTVSLLFEQAKVIVLQNVHWIIVGLLLWFLLAFGNNIRKYYYLWTDRTQRNPAVEMEKCKLQLPAALNIPMRKQLLSLQLHTPLHQIRRLPDIPIFIVLGLVMLGNMGNDIEKFLLLIWLAFNGTSTYVNSLFVEGTKAFGRYSEASDLCLFRLADRPAAELYSERKTLLLAYSKTIVYGICAFTVVSSFIFLSNKLLSFLASLIIVAICIPTHRFSCKLSSFSAFLTFSNNCKAKLHTAASNEGEVVMDTIQYIYRMPFGILPIALLLADYFYSFLTFPLLLLIFSMFCAIAIFIDHQLNQYIKKAGDVLEEINVCDI